MLSNYPNKKETDVSKITSVSNARNLDICQRFCKNPFLKKEGKKTETKKPEVSAKIEEIPDSNNDAMVGAAMTQDF